MPYAEIIPPSHMLKSNPQTMRPSHTVKSYAQTIHPNLTPKSYAQIIRPNLTPKPYAQIICSNHKPKPYAQTIRPSHTPKPYAQIITTVVLHEQKRTLRLIRRRCVLSVLTCVVTPRHIPRFQILPGNVPCVLTQPGTLPTSGLPPTRSLISSFS